MTEFRELSKIKIQPCGVCGDKKPGLRYVIETGIICRTCYGKAIKLGLAILKERGKRMGTFDTIGGYPISPQENYCDDWDDDSGCLNPNCPHHNPRCKGNCNYSQEIEEMIKKRGGE